MPPSVVISIDLIRFIQIDNRENIVCQYNSQLPQSYVQSYVLCSILIGLVIIYKYTLGHVYLYYYILLLACYYVSII